MKFKKNVQKKAINPEESQLFRDTIGNVKKIKQDKIAIHDLQESLPKFKKHNAFSTPLENALRSKITDDLQTLWQEDSLTFLAFGVQHNVLRKLRRGYYGIDAEIDLHGLNSQDAKRQLLHFLHNSVEEGFRCVHIVHGKGYRSLDNMPVLKNNLNQWLRQHNDVQAFCSASPKDGGTGAVFVLLKLSKKFSFDDDDFF